MTRRYRTLKHRVAVFLRPARRLFAAFLRTDRHSDHHAFAEQIADIWPEYEAWLAVNGRTETGRRNLAHALAAHENLPKISVIMPTRNGDIDHLKQAVQSVRDQEYPHWQLCIADDGTDQGWLGNLLNEFVASDPRIRLTTLEKNIGIAAASNAAAAMADGTILAFLDHDDLLAPEALGEVALHYLTHPDTDLAYSDDDKIDFRGLRRDPQFKPAWSPTLLMSFMYLGHLMSVRRTLFESLGGFRSSHDGAQDYDFALRAQEHARRVGHIPRILYHWRISPGSTALDGEAKPYAIEAGRRALAEAVTRRDIDTKAVGRTPWAISKRLGLYGLTFKDTGPTVDVIVVATAEREPVWRDILRCTSYIPASISVVRPDTEGTVSLATRIHQVLIQTTASFVAVVDGELNSLDPQWLSQLIGYASLPGIAVSAATVIDDEGYIQGGGLCRPPFGNLAPAFLGRNANDGGYMSLNGCAREVIASASGCWVARRSTWTHLGALPGQGLIGIEMALAEVASKAGDGVVAAVDVRMISTQAWALSTPSSIGHDPFMPFAAKDWSYALRSACAPARPSKEKVEVAFVFHNLNFEGASITMSDVVSGLVQAGFISAVAFTPRDGPLKERLEKAGVRVVILPALDLTQDSDAIGRAMSDLSAALKTTKATVLAANTIRMFSAIATAASLEIPSILCQHESEEPSDYFNYLKEDERKIAYGAFSQAYAVVYVAEATRHAWRALETRRNFRVIRNALPPALSQGYLSRSAARALLGIPHRTTVILSVGSLCRRKRQLDAVQALAAMPPHQREHTLLMLVGHFAEADYVEEIRSAITTLGVSHLTLLTGAVDTTAPYFAAADLYVCPSQTESAPRVLLQALNAALPVVTTHVFGIPEIVGTGPQSVYFDVGDVTAFASGISECLPSDDLYEQRRQHSRARFLELPTYEAMISEFDELIREAHISSVPKRQ